MAKVHVCNVLVLDNPAKFMTKLEFEITFECIEDLPEDLEWKIIYVGSAESEEFDQILDTVYVSSCLAMLVSRIKIKRSLCTLGRYLLRPFQT